jgi:hypothetical protein
LFAAFVAKFLHLALESFPLEELKDLVHALLGSQGADEAAEEEGLSAIEGVFIGLLLYGEGSCLQEAHSLFIGGKFGSGGFFKLLVLLIN